jgi:hypothetical protein
MAEERELVSEALGIGSELTWRIVGEDFNAEILC